MTWDYDNAPTDPHHGGKMTAEMAKEHIERLREKDKFLTEALKLFDAHMATAQGCGDGYCFVTGKAKGMHTNAGCRCWKDPIKAQRVMRAAAELRAALFQIEEIKT